VSPDVFTRLELVSVATEVAGDVAPVAEEVHDVVKIVGVAEPERVAQLVKAGQVDDHVRGSRLASGDLTAQACPEYEIAAPAARPPG
jgi:hypothetical protein